MQYPLLLGLILVFATPLSAQTALRLTVGATKGSDLVKDELGGPVALGTAVAPTVSLAVAQPIGGGYRALVEARAGHGNLRADSDGETSTLASVTTLGVMVLVDGPLTGGVRWEVGAGLIKYRPAERSGTFAQGGPTPWLIGAGLTWTRPLSSALNLVASGRYDFHQFRSRQLETRGYSQYRTVHRVGLGIGIERSF